VDAGRSGSEPRILGVALTPGVKAALIGAVGLLLALLVIIFL